MFAVIRAMPEFERSLIREGVKAGLRNARAKEKKLGRPVARCTPIPPKPELPSRS